MVPAYCKTRSLGGNPMKMETTVLVWFAHSPGPASPWWRRLVTLPRQSPTARPEPIDGTAITMGDAESAESLVSQAELARRWGVTSRTVKRRLGFLGITTLRRGRCRCLTMEQLALAERFHQHLSQGKDSSSFNIQDHEALETQVIPAQQPTAPISNHDLAPQHLTALATALLAQLAPSADPLQRARGLAEAADARLVLTSKELAEVLGHGIAGWRNSRDDYGFHFTRHKQQGKVLWTVERSLWSPPQPKPPVDSPQASGPFLGRMGQY